MESHFTRKSITPQHNTGFHAKLIIVKKPELENIKIKRASYQDILKNKCLNQLKIFLGINNQGTNSGNYKKNAVQKDDDLKKLSKKSNLDLDTFFEVCNEKSKLNINNFFYYFDSDIEIDKLYSLGRKCHSTPSDENYGALLYYLKELNIKEMSKKEISGTYFSLI